MKVSAGQNPQEFPVLNAFFSNESLPAPADLYDLVLLDQQQRWLNEERRVTEDYLARFPELLLDHERLLDVVYHEFLLQKQFGPLVEVGVYVRRFPMLANGIREQVEFHAAIAQLSATKVFDAGIREACDNEIQSERKQALPRALGRYQLKRQLGAGGMGDIYVAHDTELDRQVAIKLPKPEFEQTHGSSARFLREARALAAIQHPNICPIYDFGEHDQQYFIVMPLLVGQNLATYLEFQERLSTEEAVRLVSEIAHALQEVHHIGIAHRDLKPANLILDDRRTPIVVDFGLVHFEVQHDNRLTSSGALAGTPAYLPPERLKNDKNVDMRRADIYSLGVILYELITGSLPYRATSASQYLAQVLTEAPDPPSARVVGLPQEIDEICMKAMAKSPTDRFASMSEFAIALAACSTAGAGSAVPSVSQCNAPVESSANPGKTIKLTVLLMAVLLAFIAPLVLFLNPTTDSIVKLSAGEVLKGTYIFQPDGSTGDVELFIDKVDGTQFSGTYNTENGEFSWSVVGSLVDDRMAFELTHSRSPSAASVEVVGTAVVTGTLSSSRFIGEYQDHDSKALLTLFRQSQ